MAIKEIERNITRDEIYEYTFKIRIMPRKGYTKKGSRARANETVEINRLELVTILHKCGLVTYGYEAYTKRYRRSLTLVFSRKYGEDNTVYRIRNSTRKLLRAKR